MTDKRELAAEIAAKVGDSLRGEFPHRSDLCVLATRVGLEVYRYFGIEGKPIVVRTLAYNDAWRAFAKLGVPATDARWQEALDNGAHSVAIDETDHKIQGRYPGHLVIVLPDDWTLVDLSLRQFTREDRGMVFPDVGMFSVGESFMHGEPAEFESKLGGFVAYRRREPGSFVDFRRGTDWKMKDPLSGGIIREIKKGRA